MVWAAIDMMSKFRTGQFGAPVPASGIGTPMNATPGRLGKVTYYGPFGYGNSIPEEVAAQQMPKPAPSFTRVITGGGLPPRVVPNSAGGFFPTSIFRRMFGRGP
jgi:hypothetical protein